MSSRAQLVGLPAVALALVGGVLGVQLTHGGGRYEPLHSADPCKERTVTPQSKGKMDALTERLVLLGLDGAACRLHISREELTLQLAQSSEVADAQVDALHDGLLAAVQRMKDDGTLPEASDLVDEALDNADMNGLLETAIRHLPDAVVNAAVKVDDVLNRTIESLDLRSILENVDNEDDLQRQVNAAVEQAVKDSIVDRLKSLI